MRQLARHHLAPGLGLRRLAAGLPLGSAGRLCTARTGTGSPGKRRRMVSICMVLTGMTLPRTSDIEPMLLSLVRSASGDPLLKRLGVRVR